ncbi:DoxX family protein, partial [Rhizobium ruizarguesonis]
MTDTSKWTPYVLAILRIITALLFLEHATMKFLQFPG